MSAPFSQADVDAAKAQLAELRKTSPNILFVIARSKNKNIVVYEALKKDNALDAAKPIDVYWLDIDPEYVAAARKKGIQTDRNELNMIEKQFAYGVGFEPVQGKSDHYNLKLVALPERPVEMCLDSNGNPQARISINGKSANLVRIYVYAVERMLRTPKVEYIDVIGQDENGEYVHERIVPK